jgi:hypothetical protein
MFKEPDRKRTARNLEAAGREAGLSVPEVGRDDLDRAGLHRVSDDDTVMIECRLPADSPPWLRALTQEFSQLVTRIAYIVRDMEREGVTLTRKYQLMHELANWMHIESEKFGRTEPKEEPATIKMQAERAAKSESMARG